MRLAPLSYTLLRVYKDEKNVVRYRNNGLVPQHSINKPLPYYDVVKGGQFVRRIYFLNKTECLFTDVHGPFLNRAQKEQPESHDSPNIHENDIIVDYPDMVEELEAFDRAIYIVLDQIHLRMQRKHSLLELCMKLSAKLGDMRAVVQEVNSRQLGESFETTENYLLKLGMYKPGTYLQGRSKWKQTPEYKALQAAVARAKNRALVSTKKISTSFSISNLPIKHKDDSYTVPMVCPVLGLKLVINGNPRALAYMTVWRKDIRYSLTPENTCVMSNIASRMIEGARVSKETMAEVLAAMPDAKEKWNRWCDIYRTGMGMMV